MPQEERTQAFISTLESLHPALRPGAHEVLYRTAPEMTDLPDVLWPRKPFKRGQIRPPMIHFGICMSPRRFATFFDKYPRENIKPTVKELGIKTLVPEWIYVQFITSNIAERPLTMRQVYVGGHLANVVSFWNTYTAGKDQELTEKDKEVIELFQAEPAWYLDAMFPNWDVKR